ncbi:hypothetical protein HYS31_08670 [Candidatus Woesearchaeota archaeon]|nr:hypothetical protein [Candidatus Woesearchaeota archaeon]
MESEHECCKSKGEEDCCKNKHAEKIGMKNIVLAVMVAVVLLLSIVQSFQINSMKGQISANAVKSASGTGGIDMTGWTEDEKMMYEHHGTLPARLGSSNPSSGMVGGC